MFGRVSAFKTRVELRREEEDEEDPEEAPARAYKGQERRCGNAGYLSSRRYLTEERRGLDRSIAVASSAIVLRGLR